MCRTGGSSWLAGSLMPGPLEWAPGRQAEPSLVMGRWVGEESWAGRTGNSAERGQEGAMAWKLSCPTLPPPLSTILRGPCQLNDVTESTAKPGCLDLAQPVFGLTEPSSCPRIPYLSHPNPQEWLQSLQGERWEGKCKLGVVALGPSSNCIAMSNSFVNPINIGVYYVMSTVLEIRDKKWTTSAIKKLWGESGIVTISPR